ncbi:hypothetical protein CDAR_190311 [Caerostris darwini]|uniref:Uncharacterized protein n=1 Tax=Caerostris darwini TaxID=1538125 RepID=A0AAV4MPA0_9ARAC|nr:hypothetical protein CDAR_190311 [Caerostris darwini]
MIPKRAHILSRIEGSRRAPVPGMSFMCWGLENAELLLFETSVQGMLLKVQKTPKKKQKRFFQDLPSSSVCRLALKCLLPLSLLLRNDPKKSTNSPPMRLRIEGSRIFSRGTGPWDEFYVLGT